MGKAARFELRCHTSPLALSQDNFTRQGILVPFPEDDQPMTFGALQTIEARIPWTNEVFYYGLVSYDEAGNMGEVSNLVEAYVEEITTRSEEVNVTLSDIQLNLGEDSWFLDKSKIYIIAGVVAGVILVVVLLVACLIARARRLARDKTRWAQDTYEAGFSPEVARVEKVETESGIYSWLESLPRSERKEEEGSSSSSSRPTTSTDDSISDSGEQHHPHHQHSSRHSHNQMSQTSQPPLEKLINSGGVTLVPKYGRPTTVSGGMNSVDEPDSDYQIYVKSVHSDSHQRLSTAESALMDRLTGVGGGASADLSPYHHYVRSPYHNFHRPPDAAHSLRSAGGQRRLAPPEAGGRVEAQLRLTVEPVHVDAATERKRRHESVV
jgi:hypothetical protein